MKGEIISSLDNKMIKEARSLNDKKFRRFHGKFLVDGEKLVREVVCGAAQVDKIFVDASKLSNFIKEGKLGIFCLVDDVVMAEKGLDTLLNDLGFAPSCAIKFFIFLLSFFDNKVLGTQQRAMLVNVGWGSYFDLIYSSIDFAAVFPDPIARITVAAPVTTSPPAYTNGLEVAPCSSAIIHPRVLVSSPFVVFLISGFGV